MAPRNLLPCACVLSRESWHPPPGVGSIRHMSSRSSTLVVLAAFVAGCAAAKLLTVPPAGAQNVQRWDYYCEAAGAEGINNTRNLVKGLQSTTTKAGQEGWELVVMDNFFLCFKRPVR